MSITEDVYLPTEEDLTVQEVNISGPCLKAGGFHLGKVCQFENNEFVLCRNETGDPRMCLNEGKAVTACTLGFFRAVKKNCAQEFMQYVNCLDKSSTDGALPPCRKTQAAFDHCMKDKLDVDRPPHDYFARVQIHKAKRPRPEPEKKPGYEDRTPYLPEGTVTSELPGAKYGARYLWQW